MITFSILQLLVLFNALVLLIFFHSKIVRAVFYNCLPSVLIVLHYVAEDFLHIPDPWDISLHAGLLFYPATLCLLVADYLEINKKDLWSSLIIAPFIALSFSVASGVSPETVVIYHFVIYGFFILKVRSRLFVYINLAFLVLLVPLFTGILYFLFRDIQAIVFVLLIFNIITVLIFLHEYSKRIKSLSERLSAMNLMHERMEQNINRLKQSNEQLTKIISQKDTELFQLARHASLAEITTGIAHELSQPLTGIKCIAQSIIDDINYEELDILQAVSDLSKISSLVDRSSLIIEHIRSFSRKKGIVRKPIDINNCIISAVDLIKNQLKNSEIDILLQLEEKPSDFKGDSLALEQVMINLLINARDAIITKRESEPQLQGLISVRTYRIDRILVVEISDNGCGIPPDVMPKIWSPFFTTKKGSKGTGIGLSLCQRIIKEHNGFVSVESGEEGTKFIIRFEIDS